MSDPDRLVAILAAVFVVALTVWCIRDWWRDQCDQFDAQIDAALGKPPHWEVTDLAIEPTSDGLKATYTRRYLTDAVDANLTDLQRAETPADIWETS